MLCIADIFNFNPHSRTGSDTDFPSLMHVISISIHTPARGVTSLAGRYAFHGISIHTPARGVTDDAAQVQLLDILFQSTLPHGE